jgi:hypothetical protein
MKEIERIKYSDAEKLASNVWLEQVPQSRLGIINAIKNGAPNVLL